MASANESKREESEQSDAESDEEDIYERDDTQMVAPRILPGKEAESQWTMEGPCSGMRGTTAEGAIGRIMRKQAMLSRTPEERFRDAVCKISFEAQIPIPYRDGLIRLIPRIPDVGYKNAAGCLLGFMAVPFIGKTLSKGERKKLDEILALVEKIKDKSMRISELDVVRYGRLMQRLTTVGAR